MYKVINKSIKGYEITGQKVTLLSVWHRIFIFRFSFMVSFSYILSFFTEVTNQVEIDVTSRKKHCICIALFIEELKFCNILV